MVVGGRGVTSALSGTITSLSSTRTSRGGRSAGIVGGGGSGRDDLESLCSVVRWNATVRGGVSKAESEALDVDELLFGGLAIASSSGDVCEG